MAEQLMPLAGWLGVVCVLLLVMSGIFAIGEKLYSIWQKWRESIARRRAWHDYRRDRPSYQTITPNEAFSRAQP